MTRTNRCLFSVALAMLAGTFVGCETNGWLIDPQRTGYFQTTPTSIPILDRIDVIEQARDTHVVRRKPNTEDLVPKAIEYRLAPGDVIRVTIPGLLGQGQGAEREYKIGTNGSINLPYLNSVQAADRTVTQLENMVLDGIKDVIKNPTVSIQVVEGRAYEYRVLGSVEQPGLFALNKPDMRLLDALATARGAAPTTTRILVTRKPRASDSRFELDFNRKSDQAPSEQGSAPQQEAGQPAAPATTAPATKAPSTQDFDDLINQLDNAAPVGGPAGTSPATAPAPAAPTEAPSAAPASAEPAAAPAQPERPTTSPGMLSSSGRQEPAVDIDTLETAKSKDQAAAQPAATPLEGDRYTFDPTTNTWVKVGKGPAGETSAATAEPASISSASAPRSAVAPQAPAGLRTASAAARTKSETKKAFDSEVIEIDYNTLVRGDANLNVIVRPGDLIYCDQGDVGVVYIDGLIARPGVYNLPTSGKLTLSRLVAAAGGLGELAIPQRVDLVRRLGEDKEACIRVNLAAIRNRAEPDIFMKPDDHVHIGTNFWATPLAVIRNGFRMTYGFGFLVDRNWGNDIFGPPPTNVLGQ